MGGIRPETIVERDEMFEETGRDPYMSKLAPMTKTR